MKNIFLFLLVGMFLLSLTSVSAWDWDNVIAETGTDPNTGYPTMEVSNCDFWVGIPTLFGTCLNKGETLFEGSVTEHTKQCGEDCSSKLEFNHAGGVLIDDIRFLTKQNDDSWIKQPVRNYNLKYEAELPQYETQCIDLPEVYDEINNTYYTPQSCSQVQIGTYTGFKNYNVGESLPSGYYEMFLEAEKKPSRTVDWQIKVEGRWMTEWAVWSSEKEIQLKTGETGISSTTSESGIKFNVTTNITLTGIDQFASNGGTKAYLRYENNTLIESSTISGTFAEFNSNLYTTETYLLTVDAEGVSYSVRGLTGQSYPFTVEPIKVIAEESPFVSTYYVSIENITYINLSESSITLNSPTDNYISDTDNVTFNATAEVTNGAYLTNMSLWTNLTGTWALLSGTSAFNFTDGSLVAYYPLNETTGTVRDVSMTGHDGQVGNAFDFDGVKKDVLLSNSLNPNFNSVSIAVWFKTPSSLGTTRNIVSSTASGLGNDLSINIQTDGTLIFRRQTSSTNYDAISTATFDDNQWHLAIGTIDSTNGMKLYIDNSLNGTNAFSSSATKASPFYIGGADNPSRMNGSIDEVVFFNTAIDGTLRTSLWNSGLGKSYADLTAGEKTNLISYYSLDEVGSDPLDSHGSNDGTLSGGTANPDNNDRGATGIIEQAIDFDGSTTYVDGGNLGITGDWSASLWAKNNTNSENDYPLSFDNTCTGGGCGIVVSGGNIGLWDGITFLDSGINPDGLNHYIVIKDSTNYSIYINGTYKASATLADININDLIIGSKNNLVSGQMWNGIIDEVGIWNRALNSTEISKLYNEGAGLAYSADVPTTSSTQTWTKTISDTTIWNVQACDSDGDCGFATSNYTVSLDATAPNITTTLPTGDFEIPYLGWNTTYNATTTDTNLEDCWYSEDQGITNTTYTCNTAITNRTLLKGVHHLTFYANDSVSNLGTDYSNFTISLYSDILLNITNPSGTTISPTCTIDHGSVNSSYYWIGETIDRESTLSCELNGYGDETWTIEPNQSIYNLEMDYAYLNITFDDYVNATITPSSLGAFTNVTNIFVNQSDIDEGKVTVLYNLQEDGGVQQYTYENDLQTSLNVNLHVISGIFQQTEIKALESSVGLDDAIIRVYEQVSGEWTEIYSEYTNSYGTAIAYVIPDKIYRITGNKEGYQQGSTVETILIGSTDVIYVILSKLASFSYDTDLFYSNCNAQIGTAKDCYSKIDLVEDAGNITIFTVWNDTTYIKTCTDTDVCQTPAYRIANATSILTSYAVIDKETFSTTISIIFKDFELRLIQFEWAEEIKSNTTYLSIFYILTFLAGIFLAFSVEQKQKGFGKWTISIWFGILAFTGFALYWFVIIPVIVLNLGKLIRGRT